MRKRTTALLLGGAAAGGLLSIAGCPTADLEQLINTASDAVNRTIDNLQEQDILNVAGPAGAQVAGLNVQLGEDVTVITDPAEGLEDIAGANATLLAFQNDTGNDMYLRYVVNGREETVLVFAGETSLLRYPCIRRVLLLAEWDFDPETGEFVRGFEFRGGRLDNPDGADVDFGDFDCPDPNDFFGGDPNDFGDPNDGADPNDFVDPNDPNGFGFDPNAAGDPNEPNAPAQIMPAAPHGPRDPCAEVLDVPLGRPGAKRFSGDNEGFACGELVVIRIDEDLIEIRSRVALSEDGVE